MIVADIIENIEWLDWMNTIIKNLYNGEVLTQEELESLCLGRIDDERFHLVEFVPENKETIPRSANPISCYSVFQIDNDYWRIDWIMDVDKSRITFNTDKKEQDVDIFGIFHNQPYRVKQIEKIVTTYEFVPI